MNRRACLTLASSAVAAAVVAPWANAQNTVLPVQPFSEDLLNTAARDLASKPYVAPTKKLDEGLDAVTYDQYRESIAFKPENAIWREESLEFRLDLFQAAGAFYSFPVDISIVQNGSATPVAYSPQLFSFAPPVRAPGPNSQSGFAGFRVRSPVNGDPTLFDEVLTFLGASYFRGLGASQSMGLSSCRGLAINTGQSGGEEFPIFRSFWIEKPKPGDKKLTIHALLDSVSATGRYKFIVTPGAATVAEVEATIYPRKKVPYIGIAPITGMFFFAPHAPAKKRDIHPRVHDIEGLSMQTGNGEWIWRPVINPERLQFSVFTDRNPKGFGLQQRARDFQDYQDLSSNYERRPSFWIEPRGDWGEGFIDLIELPASDELHDNVIAFWRPKEGLSPNPSGDIYKYAISFEPTPLMRPKNLAAMQTRIGETRAGEVQFVVDFGGPVENSGIATGGLAPNLSTSSGEIRGVGLVANSNIRGYRLSFLFIPSGNQTADIRAVIQSQSNPVSETWLFRWAR